MHKLLYLFYNLKFVGLPIKVVINLVMMSRHLIIQCTYTNTLNQVRADLQLICAWLLLLWKLESVCVRVCVCVRVHACACTHALYILP